MLLEMGPRLFDLDFQLIADSVLMIIALVFLSSIIIIVYRLLKLFVKMMHDEK